jgi:DNA-binding phage protein
MNQPKFDMDKINALPEFKVSDYLDGDEMIVAYLREIQADDKAEPDPDMLRAAIGSVIVALTSRAKKKATEDEQHG